MAIFASTSTITTQTVPLIIVDPATITKDYLLVWDEDVGAFVARIPDFPNFYNIDISGSNITGVLKPVNGGTGISSYNIGDMIFADEFNGEVILDKLSVGSGFYEDVLTVANGKPTWTKATNIKNIISTRYSQVSTESNNIGILTPENIQIVRVIVTITIAYNPEASMSIGTVDNNSQILNSSEIMLSKEGQYIYAIDAFYTDPVQLFYNIQNATTGAAKILVEYVSQ